MASLVKVQDDLKRRFNIVRNYNDALSFPLDGV